MALVLPTSLSIDADVVFKHLAQWSISNVTKPGSADITNEWIPKAAADFEEALLAGGYTSSDITEADYPIAYEKLRYCVAFRAALYYIKALGNQGDPAINQARWDESQSCIDMIANGNRFGELENTGGTGYVRYYVYDKTDTEMTNERLKWDDEL